MRRRETGIANLLGQLREPAALAATEVAATDTKPRSAPKAKPSLRTFPPARGEGKGSGRPRTGKRSNPDFGLHGVWLREDTFLDVTERLRRGREHPDFSELVQALLEDWMKKG